MKILISQKLLDEILSQVEFVNEESCGFLFGKKHLQSKKITNFLKAKNISRENKKIRFEIAPKDYFNAESLALEKGWRLLGIYHTHLDSPPIPSKTDLMFAFEEFSYIIISLNKGKFSSLKSWSLNSHREFIEEELEINTI